MLTGDEAPLRAPFWLIETPAEGEVVDRVLRRRFGGVMDRLARSLEQADPLEVVYPGNPDEYADVVREVVVLLAPADGDLARISDEQLRDLLRDGLARRFGEPAEPGRIEEAVRLIRAAG